MTVGVFILGAMLMNFVVMPLLIHQRGTVMVPDVRQMSEQQAEKFLGRASLNMQVERREYHPEVPQGFVISQRPRPDETIKEGRTVNVVVSMGARTQRVPDIKGQSLRQGELTLNRQGLHKGRVVRVFEETDVRERVVACSPGTEREVAEGTAVDVLVGVGGRPKPYMMPSLGGQDLLFVKDRLEKLGFRISNVRYESKKDVYPNTIVDQFPKPGTMIREGDSIELVAAGSD
jgi:serine/threonine-protein kinase